MLDETLMLDLLDEALVIVGATRNVICKCCKML
jgi:hypothetical protein